MIAILVAVDQELNPILHRAETEHIVRQQHLDFHEGTLAGQPVALLALGAGKDCARIAAELTIRCYRPDLIISAGFGGGLQSTVQDGDIVVGTEVLDLCEDSGSEVQCRSTYKLSPHTEVNVDTAGMRIHFGKILTTDEIVTKGSHKKRLGRATGAFAVDMETSAVAAVATAHHVDMLAVRCITDNDHENLPEEFNDFFIVGRLKRRRVLSACARRPHLILDLARLGLRARHAGKNLATFLHTALPLLRLPAATMRVLS